jgi:WD40 repeat protein
MTRYLALLVLMALLIAGTAAAQDSPSAPVSADNITRLQPVQTVEFADAPASAGDLINGWFALSSDGERLVSMNRAGGLVLWDADGRWLDTYSISGADSQPATVLDAAFSADDSRVVSLHSDGAGYTIAVRALDDGALTLIPFPNAPDVPMAVWMDESLPAVWLEVITADPRQPPYVLRLPLEQAGGPSVVQLPSGPEADPDAVVRIGRIAPPLAITSSAAGVVKLWNLQTGDAAAQVELGEVPSFGRVNELTGTHLAWRDNESRALHLLDFSSGQDRRVAALDGAYAQAILLSPAADVILAVNLDLQPVVVAWDAATGTRYDLGEYRTCGRTPDMVRLSRDGSTLVIGCDTGFEWWRVSGGD